MRQCISAVMEELFEEGISLRWQSCLQQVMSVERPYSLPEVLR